MPAACVFLRRVSPRIVEGVPDVLGKREMTLERQQGCKSRVQWEDPPPQKAPHIGYPQAGEPRFARVARLSVKVPPRFPRILTTPSSARLRSYMFVPTLSHDIILRCVYSCICRVFFPILRKLARGTFSTTSRVTVMSHRSF